MESVLEGVDSTAVTLHPVGLLHEIIKTCYVLVNALALLDANVLKCHFCILHFGCVCECSFELCLKFSPQVFACERDWGKLSCADHGVDCVHHVFHPVPYQCVPLHIGKHQYHLIIQDFHGRVTSIQLPAKLKVLEEVIGIGLVSGEDFGW